MGVLWELKWVICGDDLGGRGAHVGVRGGDVTSLMWVLCEV